MLPLHSSKSIFNSLGATQSISKVDHYCKLHSAILLSENLGLSHRTSFKLNVNAFIMKRETTASAINLITFTIARFKLESLAPLPPGRKSLSCSTLIIWSWTGKCSQRCRTLKVEILRWHNEYYAGKSNFINMQIDFWKINSHFSPFPSFQEAIWFLIAKGRQEVKKFEWGVDAQVQRNFGIWKNLQRPEIGTIFVKFDKPC